MTKRRRRPSPARLDRRVMALAAWRSLSVYARALYPEMKARAVDAGGRPFRFGAIEAGRAINASKNSGAKALAELRRARFISPSRRAGFRRRHQYDAIAWVVIERPEIFILDGEP